MTQINWHKDGTPGPWLRFTKCGQMGMVAGETAVIGGCGCCDSPSGAGGVEEEANARAIAEVPAMVTAWREYFAAKEELAELERQSDTTKRFDAALQRKEAAELMALAALARIDQVQP